MKAMIIALGLLSSFFNQAVAADAPSVHGMLLFGKAQPYFSHLPMFHRPHDYQAIFAVKLSPEANAAYLADAAAHPEERVYTAVPDSFSLPEMKANPKPFGVVIYRGHFERGGVPITKRVGAEIAQVIHFRKFDPAVPTPTELRYLAFGSDDETYLAHVIMAAPDFDQILKVKGKGGADVGSVVGGNVGQPLSEGSSIEIKTRCAVKPFTVEKQIYLEVDELKE